MDISEMQERKKAMEDEIAAVVQRFEEAAGIKVGDFVTLRHMDFSECGKPRRYIVTATTEVAL